MAVTPGAVLTRMSKKPEQAVTASWCPAVAAYINPVTGQVHNVQRASTQTLIGAVCFFIGALLLLPERTEETHGQVMAAGDKGAVDVGGS